MLRNSQLGRFPACQFPTDGGIPCLSTDRLNVDHITPRKSGGLDTPSNLQTLCHKHHTDKTNAEANRYFCRTPVTVVCGPSGSGKTTYVKQRLTTGCFVWDMDAVVAALTLSPLHYQPAAVLDSVRSIRQHLLSTLPKTKGLTHIWWIESGATLLARAQLRDTLNATTIVLETPSDLCKQRITNDVNRDPTYDWCALVDDWWKKYERSSLDVVIS